MPRVSTDIKPSTNYLKRMLQEAERRKWPRRKCNLCVGLLFAKNGMRNIRQSQIWLHDISESGACASSRTQNLPASFYIYFGHHQYLIGCALVGFENGNMHLRFITEQPTEFVDVLSRLTDPFEFKGSVRLSLYGLPDQQSFTKPPRGTS